MKKILLIVLSLIVMSSISFAKNINEIKSLYWVTSNQTITCYVDKNGMEYDPATDIATCYVTLNFPAEGRYCTGEYTINYKNNTITNGNWFEYYNDSDNYRALNQPTSTSKIRPSTNGDKIKNAVAGLVGRDEKLAAYKKEQEQKKAEAEEKAKSERKKEQIKQVAGSVLGGLGGLF